MRFLLAPDKFKGSLSATEAADCMADGIHRFIPHAQIDRCPIADGGEGTVAALLAARPGRFIHRTVTGPLPEMKVDAGFAMLDDRTAVIEMAAASGLAHLSEADRDPLSTTTFGTGELIAAAVREGAKKIILGLGGSATLDAGIGCAQACGFTILLRDGEPVSMSEPLCGRDLPNVLMVKHGRGEVTTGIEITAAVDVNIPLYGEQGASRLFGPQKGATPATVERLDAEFKNFVGRTDSFSLAITPGAGAAGGLGYGILAFFRGSIVSGFEFIAENVRLADRLQLADLCITSEGRLDHQTSHGKAVVGIARLCRKASVPCVALVGSYSQYAFELFDEGLTAQFSICDGPMTLQNALSDAGRLLTQASGNVARLYTSRLRGTTS